MSEVTNYDAEGRDRATRLFYGVFVSPTPPSEKYNDAEGFLIEYKRHILHSSGSGEGPLPYSKYDVFVTDLHISGTHSGIQEGLGPWLEQTRNIPKPAQKDILRLVFDHPTWKNEGQVVGFLVRIETHYNHDYVEEDDDNEEDTNTFTLNFVVFEDEDDDDDDNEDCDDEEEDGDELVDGFLEFTVEDAIRPTPASPKVVETLEKVTIRPGVEGETCCVVCFEEFSLGSEATKMPCSHVFHGDCIVRCLEYQCVCPLCRFELSSDEKSSKDIN